MSSARGRRLLDHLHSRRARTLQLLERLVAIESPSGEAESQRAVQAVLAEELESLGFRVRRVAVAAAGGHLFASAPSRTRGSRPQLLLGHCDTVWPFGSLARMPITVRAGTMSGPGIFDMKAGLAMIVAALRSLQELDLTPAVAPCVFVNSDEEIGSATSRRWVERLAGMSDRVLVLEPSFGLRGQLKTARKGVGRFVIRVHGRAAHAGLEPGRGVSAILELSHVVQHLFSLNAPERGLTVNVGTIDGGMCPNVVAPTGSATVDVRVVDRSQAEEIERHIRGLQAVTPGARLEVEGGFDLPPMERTPRNRRLWNLAQALATEIDVQLDQCLAGGGSDGNLASALAPTLDGLGAIGKGAHAVDEQIVLDSLVERGALLALLILAPAIDWPSDHSDPKLVSGSNREA